MVQTRSRTRTHQREVVEGAPKPSRSKSAIGGKSSPRPKAKEISRKRGLQQNDKTLSAPALKKSRPNAKKTADKPKAKQRTRSVSKPRTIYHEVRERGINGVNTETQRKMHIEDSTDKFYSDTMSAGDRENDPTLVDLLVQESNSAVEFLIDAGVDLTDINLCGGHSVPRTHWIPSPKEGRPIPVGFSIIKNLKIKLQEFGDLHPGKLQIMTDTPVQGIVTWFE
uniref:FAD-dependent oxidoreductase 2 FAD binding domain-containing protein n=1 Tax=Panagrolaimus davidi TaxID=227884 RepID=A0A914QZP7_9BILA